MTYLDKEEIMKKRLFLVQAAVVMFLVPIVAIAGDLELSTAPAPTMHTLDDIYNKTSAQNLPDPDTVTIVTKFKRSIDTTTWQPLHTVAQGKTFYLMGATCSGGSRSPGGAYLDSCSISFNGGGSTDFNLPACNTISASYPIAGISSRSDIMVKNTDYSADMYCTIFGYEK
jgi:hypothetical protein